MQKYRKKPVVVEASQWFKNGDHPAVEPWTQRRPGREPKFPCQYCGKPLGEHGWIETLEGGHIVCPGDYIIQGVQGEFYPCKPDIFEATYEQLRTNQDEGDSWEEMRPCELEKDGRCTDFEVLCGMTGENTCCQSCEKVRNCEEPCEYAVIE